MDAALASRVLCRCLFCPSKFLHEWPDLHFTGVPALSLANVLLQPLLSPQLKNFVRGTIPPQSVSGISIALSSQERVRAILIYVAIGSCKQAIRCQTLCDGLSVLCITRICNHSLVRRIYVAATGDSNIVMYRTKQLDGQASSRYEILLPEVFGSVLR